MKHAALMSSVRQDWCTPTNVLEAVRAVFGGRIDLDPCASEAAHVDAKRQLFVDDDGLAVAWHGQTFMNPPYGREIGPWMAKAAMEATRGVEVIALLPARTDTDWWHANVPSAQAVCWWRGRITFLGAPNPAPFPSAVVYWGPAPDLFRWVFRRHGWCS